jgi:hypothetical protein
MILSDLLDAPVHDADGAVVGRVVDVRLVVDVLAGDDGDEDAAGGPRDRETSGQEEPLAAARRRDAVGAARVVGLLVSPRSGASFLGYERTEVRSPWPLPQLVRRYHRGAFLVRWDEVTKAGRQGVHLAAGHTRRDPTLEA